MTKTPISALPLPPASHLLPLNLTPDTETPSVPAFRAALASTPSIQRRARLLAPQCHFSHVAPLPIAFPYDIPPPDDPKLAHDKMAVVERWLGAREARHARPGAKGPLSMYYPEQRDAPRELLGLSAAGIRDCVPALHVGDAFATLGTPTLAHAFDDEDVPAPAEEDKRIREELVDVLAGHAVLMSGEDDERATPFAPWALRYSGHQFGVWAGQLGDGRAVSILATPHPADPDTTYELQLKGAGRTPFARSADGLAVTRSSVREFLCAEAMHALGIPTTRSIALISLPAVPVQREREESACVLTRAAPSFVRVGCFEALNPPAGMFFLGGGQQDADWEALRRLGEWVVRRVLRLTLEEGERGRWGKELVLEVARRNARMVAGWQAYGFMHGVINTDNVSILGLTIDYGPFAFMDVFNPWHICNHTDEEGRYSYRAQPSMIMYASEALLTALAPLIGAEAELGHAVGPGWAQDVPDAKVDEWRKAGAELVKAELHHVILDECGREYGRLMHKRLGLRRYDAGDEAQLCRPLLDIMEEHKLDFHGTFRALCAFRPALLRPPAHVNGGGDHPNPASPQSPLDPFLSALLSQSPEAERMDRDKAARDWTAWLGAYAARIESERDRWGADPDAERAREARAANPRFVLRQWVLEEVIRKVEQDAESGRRVLAKVLQMACSPFEPWGAEGDETPDDQLEPEVREERRFCGMGEKQMIGFQCSCSS
ncbi:UPF0061-domain-containing protein [Gloeophyllum trabeum ATCC 11539]|uniref:Selenoprotein O n=1 Tax=Gloeophyllum trabeum (strain ATCC 11539 / FP-39264 / Madison 617) TaxID=670483 RepID=S7Q3C5_GLOTA|nr:UPF0061-domain-containing protein [Gloeophyllum trabeum ATCC 11539]EPQ54042.1 UPF0061-domain-containing protein [Gloeophyllum trabeum ATCC 11539]